MFSAAMRISILRSLSKPLGLAVLLAATTNMTSAGEVALDRISLPLVDLQEHDEFHVVVDREEGQYLGHPTTCVLDDGKTIVTVYPKGHGSGAIVKKRSTDGGKTWGPRESVPDNWSTSKETPTLFAVRNDAGKTERMLMFSGSQKKFGDVPVRMAIGNADATEWSPLRPIPPKAGIVAMASMIDRPDGKLITYYHNEGFDVFACESDDRGLTWSEPTPIIPREVYPEKTRLCEPGIIRSPDGKKWAMLLRENHRNRNSFIMFSDDGLTWSAPKELPLSLSGDRHTGVYMPDGRLFISFRCNAPSHRTSRPFEGDWGAWVGTWDDLTNRAEGQYFVRLRDNKKGKDCAYPGVECIDGTVVTVTYGHWDQGKPAYIRCVRVTSDDLDRLAKPQTAESE